MKTGLLGSTNRELLGLDDLLKDIAAGGPVEPTELLPYLCLESLEERCRVNAALAEAYAEAQNFEQAKVFIQRAWILSGGSEDLLPLYLKVHSALDDVAAIRTAYKRLGMKKAAENRIAEALNYFNQNMYAYARHWKLDHYEYDFDILERIEELAKPYRFHPRLRTTSLNHRRMRVAYLTYLMANVTSVFYRINLSFAQFHDKSLFDIAFFVPEPESAFQDKTTINLLRGYGCEVVTTPEVGGEAEKLLWLATQIFNFKPDLLVTNAVLARLSHYFIASLRPAPIIAGLIYGPPPQFAAHSLDWGITAAGHPLMDSPCDCSLVEVEVELPERARIQLHTKQQLGISDTSPILMSAGRVPKFQDLEFWRAIFEIMNMYPDVYYIAVGVSENQLPSSLAGSLAPELKARLRFLGWRQDYLEILGLADVVIDTFPSGGGFTLMDAMALGIPVVSFENNYMRSYDQTDWSVGPEIISIPDLIVERGNFGQLKLVVSKLLDNEQYRHQVGELCKEQIRLLRGNPERMVRRCESTYLRIVEDVLSKRTVPVSDGYSARQSGFLRRLRTDLVFWAIKSIPLSSRLFDLSWRFAARVKHGLFRALGLP